MRSIVIGAMVVLWAVGVALLGRSQTPAPFTQTAATLPAIATASPALAHHAVIISIDGCRPDVLLRADTPVIHNLLSQASFTFYAETTDVAITLPSHTSMLTGVKPEKHGISFNRDPKPGEIPKVPTVLQIAHAHGMTTGVFSTKSKFSLFTPANTIDYVYISKEESSADDGAVARRAAEAITQYKPGAMLVHLGNNDRTGHAVGWGTPQQLTALHGADAAIGVVLQALKDAGIDQDTLVIISADHGGSGIAHGANDPRSRYIPWIAVGPGVRKNYDLTRDRTRTVHTEDTFATACYFLGLPMDPDIDGRPVMQVLPRRELVQPK